ncbi:MAG: SusC/RagA family TonB-linked outer membrane protein [Draconibacterium sp.]|nr:SusC/RagA family TonB-linked outer membrane protein [Draconibacterium sp.]
MKKNKIYLILILGLFTMLCFSVTAEAQRSGTDISATVVDEQGNPLEGVKILAPKGISTTTDGNGKFTINAKGAQAIVVEREGYDSEVINTAEITGTISLNKSILLASERDVIKMGIKTTTKREMVGAASSVTPKDHMTYDNTQWVKNYIQGMLVGVKGSSNIRGLGNALFVIDGVIGRSPDILNMDEVDQITVLKDANAVALYGNQARNGVIIINTKRGKTNTKIANVNIQYGLKQPISLPKYLGSVQYMELYNEARMNDGFDAYYAPTLIDEYRNSSNRYRYPDIDFYSTEYLRETANTANVLTEFSGGNERTRYYINMGWKYGQSLVALNPDVNKGSNRFNVRGNIDFQVTDWIKSSVDVVAIINTDKRAHENVLNFGTTFKPNDYAPLLPVSMIDASSDEQLAAQLEAARTYDGMLLGGSQIYKENAPIGSIIAGGYQNDMFRSTQFNNSIDFDLDMITEGLSAKTYLSFDFYDAYELSINNKFSVYEPMWEGDKIIGLTPYGDVDQKDLTENVKTNQFITRLGFYGLLNYQKTFSEDHSVNATLMGYMNSHKQEGVVQANNNAHVGLQVSYDFKKKLFADFSGTYINSIKLPEGNRGGFSPTVGLGYILSEEDFIEDVDFIDYLKLKASGGILKSDLGINGYYLYNETYKDGSWFNWADGLSNREKDISQGENMLMTFEERIDLNVGLESYLFNSLWFEFNYFNTSFDKQLTTLDNKYPSFYNIFKPYDNYNKDTYKGFELGLNYTKNINDLTVSLGGNVLYAQSEVTERDEIYEYDYQYRTGKPVNAIFGLVDNGFYSAGDFTTNANGSLSLNENLPVPSYGAVQPGDIKYIDQNNDGLIDNNDRKEIGQSGNPWSYGANFRIKYKGLSLFVLGLGEFGGEANMSNDYYWVDANDKYSETVLGRWTPETANSATFPRLSSNDNKNNFRTSTFWMYNNSFFDIKRAQLTYEFSENICQKIGMSNLSVNVAGANLLQIAENRDIRQLSIGGNPQFRYFTLGLRTSF